jgi:hypothetical protein
MLQGGGIEQQDLSYDNLIASFARNNQRLLANKVVQQRRRLPPAVNDQALFLRASAYGDCEDPFYHSPCNKIGSNYSPEAAVAAAILFEEFPASPHTPRKLGMRTLKLVREAQEAGIDARLALKAGSMEVWHEGAHAHNLYQLKCSHAHACTKVHEIASQEQTNLKEQTSLPFCPFVAAAAEAAGSK